METCYTMAVYWTPFKLLSAPMPKRWISDAWGLSRSRRLSELQSLPYMVHGVNRRRSSYLSRLMQTSTKLERKRPNVRKKAIILHMASPPFHDTVMAQAISSGINKKVTCAHRIFNGVTFATMSHHASNQISCEKWRKRGFTLYIAYIHFSAHQKVIAKSLAWLPVQC